MKRCRLFPAGQRRDPIPSERGGHPWGVPGVDAAPLIAVAASDHVVGDEAMDPGPPLGWSFAILNGGTEG